MSKDQKDSEGAGQGKDKTGVLTKTRPKTKKTFHV